MDDAIRIEVVLALPRRCWREYVEVPAGTTAGEIVRRSGLDEVCARVAGETPRLGVYGRKIGADYQPRAGERIELYRGLVADPRQRRRARANTRGRVGDNGNSGTG